MKKMPRKAKHVNETLYEAMKKFLENKNIDDLKNTPAPKIGHCDTN
ncbi:MAG: hypothetical protein ABGX25_00330 [Nautiliaceae bacterium]